MNTWDYWTDLATGFPRQPFRCLLNILSPSRTFTLDATKRMSFRLVTVNSLFMNLLYFILAFIVCCKQGVSRRARHYRKHNLSCVAITGEYCHTGCGRKKSPIWEANKFKTKEDTAKVFFYFRKVHRMPFYINVF